MTERKQLQIGLFGFGCVGYGLYRVLEQSAGFKANIKTICIKHSDKKRPIASHYFTTNPDDILNDPDINVVVELIDDANAAFLIVQKALVNGKAVVSANKKMLAEHFETLLELQEQTKLPILYEAAACASIPIIRNLEEYYDNDFLSRVEGIVNGSTNYILTKSILDGLGYNEALALAQGLGYAESNPALDVEGHDARNKLIILVAHAFGSILDKEDILCVGIQNIGELEIQYAREKGYKIKLIAQAVKHENKKISAVVAPQFIKNDSPLFGVDGVYNGVITETAFADKQFFSGKGAGDFPTASAVLSDLSALSYGYRYEYKKLAKHFDSEFESNILCEAFITSKSSLENTIRSYFENVKEVYQNGSKLYISGDIRLQELRNLYSDYPDVSIILHNSLKENTSKSVNSNLQLQTTL